MRQPLAVDTSTPALSQCLVCGANVYQATINRGTDEEPDWEFVLVEVTPVRAGQGSLTLDFGAWADTYEYPRATLNAENGTIVEHQHQ